jgi:DNA polymerase-3 subunit beta
VTELAVGAEPPGGVDYGKFEFSVTRFNLHALADWVSAAVSKGATLPVLGCFQVTVSPGELRLAATDMEISVIAKTLSVAYGGQESAQVYIPAAKLQAILKSAPEGDVKVAVKKNLATVTASGGASWVLKLPDPAGYPEGIFPEEVEFAPVGREKFLAALKTVQHSVCRNAGSPLYTQVAVAEAEFAGGRREMSATSSDSVRLARAPLPGYPAAMNIPAGALDQLSKLLAGSPVEEAEVGETPQLLVFRVGPVTLAAKRKQDPFPDVEKLVLKPAQENKDRLGVDRAELLSAIARVKINADSSTSAIALNLASDHGGGTLTVVSRDKNNNSAQETIPADWDAGDRLVVVNHQFLTDMLTVHPSGACAFWLGKPLGKRRPAVLLSDDESGVTGVIPQMAPELVGY